MQFDRNKFSALVHYICASCSPEELGFVKLHKIAYFADMIMFANSGKPITGETYVKQQFGPVAQHLWDVISNMEREGALRVQIRNFYGFPKKDFISMREPDTSCFEQEERGLIDEVITFACAKTAKELSELSHEFAWQFAEMGEVIPYFTAYEMFPVEISQDDIAWGMQEAQKIADKEFSAGTF